MRGLIEHRHGHSRKIGGGVEASSAGKRMRRVRMNSFMVREVVRLQEGDGATEVGEEREREIRRRFIAFVDGGGGSRMGRVRMQEGIQCRTARRGGGGGNRRDMWVTGVQTVTYCAARLTHTTPERWQQTEYSDGGGTQQRKRRVLYCTAHTPPHVYTAADMHHRRGIARRGMSHAHARTRPPRGYTARNMHASRVAQRGGRHTLMQHDQQTGNHGDET